MNAKFIRRLAVRQSVVRQLIVRSLIVAAAVAAGGVAEAALTSSHYVQDGLIWQLDGIENKTRGGAHVASQTTWNDLSGYNGNVTVDSAWAFTNGTGLATTHTGYWTGKINNAKVSDTYFRDRLYKAYDGTGYCTIEAAYDKSPNESGKAYFVCFGSSGHYFGIQNDNKFEVWTQGGVKSQTALGSNIGKHTYAVRLNVTEYSMTVDITNNVTAACTAPKSVGHGHELRFNRDSYYPQKEADSNNAYGLGGVYHAIRMYNRPLTDDELKLNQALDMVRFLGADPATVPMPDIYRFAVTAGDTNLEEKVIIAASDVNGGVVSIDGGEAASTVYFWTESGVKATHTVKATAINGYKFICWYGDDLGDVDITSDEITVSTASAVNALFRKDDGTDPRTYTCEVTSGYWDGSSTWRDEDGAGGLPIAGDSVVIPSGRTVTVTNSLEDTWLAALEISGTLKTKNWNTQIAADTVTVKDGGVITVTGTTAANAADTNRVWIACGDLTIEAGGKINVDQLGFARNVGPGHAEQQGEAGSSHGGFGGWLEGIANYPMLPYGSMTEPETLGSGGQHAWDSATEGMGGGAVRIDANGVVTVNGSILASGGNVGGCATSATDGAFDNPGSGGSILIYCDTFIGTNGVLRAQGGGARDPRAPYWIYSLDYRTSKNSGGGRIAIHYNAENENAADVDNVEISTAAGLCLKFGETYATMDKYHAGGDCGTVWFTDSKLLDATLGKGLSGQLAFVTNYTYSGDLAWTKGHVRFTAPGAKVTIDGGLTMTNGNSRLEVGGSEYRIKTAFLDIYAGRNVNTLTVNGDVELLDGARLDIRSAGKETDSDFEKWGGVVKIDGVLHVASNSSVYAWCDVIRCTGPRFEVGSLAVDEGGLMSSEWRGGAGGPYSGSFPTSVRSSYAYSPLGHGDYLAALYSTGGQHGTRGGTSSLVHPQPACYDNGDAAYRPEYSGSGGAGGGYGDGGAGGGIIYVESAGAMRVDGEINVDGGMTLKSGNHYHCDAGSGSGGTIFLSGKSFTGGANAKLSACGGLAVTEQYHTDTSKTAYGYAGAGGAIAIWTGAEYPGSISHRRVTKATSPEGLSGFNFTGTAVADAGGRYFMEGRTEEDYPMPEQYQGGAGSIWFCNVQSTCGFMIILRTKEPR